MFSRAPRSTWTYTLFPSTTLCLSCRGPPFTLSVDLRPIARALGGLTARCKGADDEHSGRERNGGLGSGAGTVAIGAGRRDQLFRGGADALGRAGDLGAEGERGRADRAGCRGLCATPLRLDERGGAGLR